MHCPEGLFVLGTDFQIEKNTERAPESWMYPNPNQISEVWCLKSHNFTCGELMPFDASCIELDLWGYVEELGFLPIVEIYRVDRLVIWLARLDLWQPNYITEHHGLKLIFDGATYESRLQKGSYEKLPEISTCQKAIHWWLTDLEFDWGEYLAQDSSFSDESVELFVQQIKEWYCSQIAVNKEIIYNNFQEHNCYQNCFDDAREKIVLELTSGKSVVCVSFEKMAVKFEENPCFPLFLTCPQIVGAIKRLSVIVGGGEANDGM